MDLTKNPTLPALNDALACHNAEHGTFFGTIVAGDEFSIISGTVGDDFEVIATSESVANLCFWWMGYIAGQAEPDVL